MADYRLPNSPNTLDRKVNAGVHLDYPFSDKRVAWVKNRSTLRMITIQVSKANSPTVLAVGEGESMISWGRW